MVVLSTMSGFGFYSLFKSGSGKNFVMLVCLILNLFFIQISRAEQETSEAQKPTEHWYSSTLEKLKHSQDEVVSVLTEKYGKVEVQIEGADKVSRAEIERYIPSGANFLWWRFNQDELRARFSGHPLIKDITISKCQDKAGSECLRIKLEERKPRLWVKTELEGEKMTRYLIAGDGTILAALGENEKIQALTQLDRDLLSRFTAADLSELPVFDARNLPRVSDASSQLFKKAVEVFNLIEKLSGLKIYAIRFLGGTEVETDFETQPFTVVFDLGENFSDANRIEAQMSRLNRILKEKPALASRAARVNLGLDREVSVVLAQEKKNL